MPWQKNATPVNALLADCGGCYNDVELMVIALEAACITTYDTTDSLITCQQLRKQNL